MKDDKSGGHEWLIEFKTPPKDLLYFTDLLDNSLKALNSDYEAKRYNSLKLSSPKVRALRQGVFHEWLKNKDKLGGQHKIPRLSNSRLFIEELLKLS